MTPIYCVIGYLSAWAAWRLVEWLVELEQRQHDRDVAAGVEPRRCDRW